MLNELTPIWSEEISLKFTLRLEFQARTAIAVLKGTSSSLGDSMLAPKVFN